VKFNISWLKYLTDFRGQKVVKQALHMFRLHSIPFSELLENMFNVLEPYQAKFTFPVIASVAAENPELTRSIMRHGHEVAVHGFKHVNYAYITERQQDNDIRYAIDEFKVLKIPVFGFRAPYNVYTEGTPKLVEKHGFLWDIGIGYNPKYRRGNSMFRVQIDDHESGFVCVPLNRWSDDYMTDIRGFSVNQMKETLKQVIKGASEKGGVVMFDLHPIRIGQPKYVEVLDRLVEYGAELNGWFPSVTEAVNYWREHRKWKHDAQFCCLLSGDIDNFSFFDYLQRLF
jgi:peptidoglycan/xylan/chitin deacetylase (PgdA/CDA1 family)